MHSGVHQAANEADQLVKLLQVVVGAKYVGKISATQHLQQIRLHNRGCSSEIFYYFYKKIEQRLTYADFADGIG